MSAYDALRETAARQHINLSSVLGLAYALELACEYIDNQQSEDAFVDFLAQQEEEPGVTYDEAEDLPGADYAWVLALRPRDRVTWNDPSDGTCTRTDTIKAIYFRPDFVGITWADDSDLEALYDELEEAPDES